MTVTIDEWREIHAAHPSRQIRVGDYLLTIDTPCITNPACPFHGIQALAPRSVDPDPRLSSIIPPQRPVEVISEAGDITDDQWAYLEGMSAAMDKAAAARPQYHGIQGLPGGNNGGPNGSAGR